MRVSQISCLVPQAACPVCRRAITEDEVLRITEDGYPTGLTSPTKAAVSLHRRQPAILSFVSTLTTFCSILYGP